MNPLVEKFFDLEAAVDDEEEEEEEEAGGGETGMGECLHKRSCRILLLTLMARQLHCKGRRGRRGRE
jgi:Spt5 transcription elongation factor, acidic N-terminal